MNDFVKITEDLYYNENFNIKDNLTKQVDIMLFGDSCDYVMGLEESLIDCESPIEQLLSLELQRIGIVNMLSYNPFIDVVAIDKQKEINIKEKIYRVDFYIPVHYITIDGKDIYQHYIIECDGHEFHQKTKEQVERDNKRQRDLQNEGYMVIRFSGTEIYHKSYQCASEIKRIIINEWLRMIGADNNGRQCSMD